MAAIWVLDTTLVVVSQGVVAVAATVVDDDVALAVGGLGHERRGWGVSSSGVGRPGSVCRRFRGARGCFIAGGRVVVAVDDSVDVVDGVDGGCADVVSGDMVVAVESSLCVMGGFQTCWGPSMVCIMDLQALEVSVDVPTSLSGRGGSLRSAICITVSTLIMGVAWVLTLMVRVVVVWVLAFSCDCSDLL